MLTSGERLRLHTIHEPTLDFARSAAYIGYSAWRDRFVGRTEAEITRVFNPRDPAALLRSMSHAKRRSASGNFVGILAIAYDKDSAASVGFGWAVNDTSGNWLGRQLKNMRRLPYAWLAQLNVTPAYQRNLIGTAIAGEVYSHFHKEQVPTTYVFDENPSALRYFTEKLGFSAQPAAPSEIDFFGNNTDPIRQYRLVAPSVHDIQSNIWRSHNELPVDPNPPHPDQIRS